MSALSVGSIIDSQYNSFYKHKTMELVNKLFITSYRFYPYLPSTTDYVIDYVVTSNLTPALSVCSTIGS